ncbi:hypothetical protein ACNKHO_25255 [Shigella flexneri]
MVTRDTPASAPICVASSANRYGQQDGLAALLRLIKPVTTMRSRDVHQQLLQRRDDEPSSTCGCAARSARKITRVEQAALRQDVAKHGGHQTCGPHFTVADRFRIHRIGNPAVQRGCQALKVIVKGGSSAVRHVRRQQTGNQTFAGNDVRTVAPDGRGDRSGSVSAS